MAESHITWKAVLYESKHKSVDWFWMLGFFVVLGTGVSIYFGNYPFASALLVGGLVLGMFANDHIQEEEYNITTSSIETKDEIYKYSDIKSFWVFTEGAADKHRLLLNLKRTFFNHITIPLGDTDPEKVRLVLRKYVLERKQLPLLSDAIMDWLKF